MEIQSIIYNSETTVSTIATLSIASLAMVMIGCYLLFISHAKYVKARKMNADVVLTICTTFAVITSSFILAYHTSFRIHAPEASLTSIETFITVKDDKVTIKSWSKDKDLKKFKYDIDLSLDPEQVFQLKADETYDRYSLIDSRYKEHPISKEEYEMLKSKRHG